MRRYTLGGACYPQEVVCSGLVGARVSTEPQARTGGNWENAEVANVWVGQIILSSG